MLLIIQEMSLDNVSSPRPTVEEDEDQANVGDDFRWAG